MEIFYQLLKAGKTSLLQTTKGRAKAIQTCPFYTEARIAWGSVLLLLLDLSAAFGTVDHSTLLLRLRTRFGVKRSALAWFESYLASRKYYVQVEGYKSSLRSLGSGVPQGSVLGPLLYMLYTSPVTDIIKSHDLQYHFYADDTQLYITFKTDSTDDVCLAKFFFLVCKM